MSLPDHDVHEWIAAIRASHERLDNLVRRLDAESLVRPSYCDDWSIAQVLSHLGSGAEMMLTMIDSAIGESPPMTNDERQGIWAQWNAKEPQQQAADYQVADERLVNRWESLEPGQLERFQAELGPWKLSAADTAGMRLGEHALHTWDIQVSLEPDATLPDDAASLLLTRMGWMAGIAGKADRWSGGPARLSVHVTDLDQRLLLEIDDKVQLTAPVSPSDGGTGEAVGTTGEADENRSEAVGELTTSADAFVRLFYGRLDADHTPAGVTATGAADLDELRSVFPGF